MSKHNDNIADQLGDEQRDQLAAEYVLGTLATNAREQAARRINSDAQFASQVTYWEGVLGAIDESLPQQSPDAIVWKQLEQRLNKKSGIVETRRRSSMLNGFWRGLVSGSAMVAVIAAVVWFTLEGQVEPFNSDLTAVLSSTADESGTSQNWMAQADLRTNSLQITRMNSPPVPAGKTMELWVMPMDGGDPIPCGLVADVQQQVISMADASMLLTAKALAISIEPAGGSLTGKPTGPVVYIGNISPGGAA